jgi:uncharacterized membrane protein
MIRYDLAMRQYLDLIDRVQTKRQQAGQRFKEEETVRLFTASGHPWMALTSLLLWRVPVWGTALAAVIYAMHAAF